MILHFSYTKKRRFTVNPKTAKGGTTLRLCETKYFYFFSKKEAHAKPQSRQGFNSFRFPAVVRLCEITKKSSSKSLLKGILCGPTWNRTKHLLPRRIGGVSCSVLSLVDQKLKVFGYIFEFSNKNLAFHSFDKHFHFSSMRNGISLYAKV